MKRELFEELLVSTKEAREHARCLSTQLTVGELFAGIGGIGLGFERAGFQVKWALENEPYAAAVYRKNFPNTAVLEKGIKTWDSARDPRYYVDVIAGGFPCQDISLAGKGAGINGKRSGLWAEFARIVKEIRPQYVVAENVPALRTRGLGRVLSDLMALGYMGEWHCFPASAVGAPHQRDRIWIVAYSNASRNRTSNNESCKRSQVMFQRQNAFCGVSRQSKVVPQSNLQSLVGTAITRTKRYPWVVEPSVGRVAHGIPARVDRLRCLGNAVVPQCAQVIAEALKAFHESQIV